MNRKLIAILLALAVLSHELRCGGTAALHAQAPSPGDGLQGTPTAAPLQPTAAGLSANLVALPEAPTLTGSELVLNGQPEPSFAGLRASQAPVTSGSGGSAGGSSTGLTTSQRLAYAQASATFAFSAEGWASWLRQMATMVSMDAVATFARYMGPTIGALGCLLGICVLFISASDATLTYLESEFQQTQQQLQNIENALQTLPSKFDSSNSLQDYIQQRNNVKSLQLALNNYVKYPTDSAVLNTLIAQCDDTPADNFLAYIKEQITADGSCGTADCVLNPDAGIALDVKWSRPDFLTFAKVVVSDTIQASQLQCACAGAKGESNDSITAMGDELAGQYDNILDNLESYYVGAMTKAFWKDQFSTDLHDGLNEGGENQNIATHLQELLASKYDFLQWSVAIWSSVTGHQNQGIVGGSCDPTDNSAPPETCSASGGAFHRLSYALDAGSQLSIMVFWSPTSEGDSYVTVEANVTAAVDACGQEGSTDTSNLATLATCVSNYFLGKSRGVLCVKFGLSLRAQMQNIYFANVKTQWISTGRDGPSAVNGPEVSFIVLQPAP